MKNFMIMLCAIALLASCAKEPADQFTDPINNDTTCVLKVGNSVTIGDTTYATPGVLKFYLDNLALPVNQYVFVWNLGGTASSAPEPEQNFEIGIYPIQVTVTPINGGTPVSRSTILKIALASSAEFTIIPLSANQTGTLWDYKFGMRTTAVDGYANMTTSPWIYGSFADPNTWTFENISETTLINDISYLVYHVFVPIGDEISHEWLYGRGEGTNKKFSFAPSSIYWVTISPTEGKFRAYFKNGIISFEEINVSGQIPGDNGDIESGPNPPTVRTTLVYSAIPGLDSLKIFINYGYYANGPQPFAKKMITNNNWESIGLAPMSGNYAGWGYKTFSLSTITDGRLILKFGPNITQNTSYGEMQYSKFYKPDEQWLQIQITETRSAGKSSYDVSTLNQNE